MFLAVAGIGLLLIICCCTFSYLLYKFFRQGNATEEDVEKFRKGVPEIYRRDVNKDVEKFRNGVLEIYRRDVNKDVEKSKKGLLEISRKEVSKDVEKSRKGVSEISRKEVNKDVEKSRKDVSEISRKEENEDYLHSILDMKITRLKQMKQFHLIEPTVEVYNRKIFDFVNKKNNKYKIDLHGLYAKYAIKFLMDRIQEIRRQKYVGKVQAITGIGNHSENGEAKIKPLVEKALILGKYSYKLGNGGGCFIIYL